MTRVLLYPAIFFLFLACAAPIQLLAATKTIRNVIYVKRGKRDLKADVYLPGDEGPFPGVLLIHGGAWATGSKSHMRWMAPVFVKQGYTVVAIQYRFAPRHKFPAQVEDCKEAIRWMRRNAKKYKIDPKRIAAGGYSAGGHLAALLGVTDKNDGLEGEPTPGPKVSTRVQAVIVGGAPCDFTRTPPNLSSYSFLLGGTRAEKPEAYRRASPISFATKDDPPTWFYHGGKDRLVPLRLSQVLRDKLQRLGVRTEMYVLPKAGHLGAFFNPEPSKRAAKFLNSVLKKPRTLGSD